MPGASIIRNAGIIWGRALYEEIWYMISNPFVVLVPWIAKSKISRHFASQKKSFFSNKDWKSLAKTCVGFLNISGKGGFGNTKFIAFEKLAWHYECFICACCNESMVGKGFIQDEGAIICPECARKKMLEEMEEENEEESRVQTRVTNY